MSTLRGRSQIGPDGSLRIPLPGVGANTEVEYTLEFHASTAKGRASSVAVPRAKTGADRRESLRRLAGSVDDPTFIRPQQGEYEKRESMD